MFDDVEVVRRKPVAQNERGCRRSARCRDADVAQSGRIQRQLIFRSHALDEVVVDPVAAADDGCVLAL